MPLNADEPIVFNSSPNDTKARAEQPLNTLFPSDSSFPGRFMFVSDVQFSNAPLPILSIEGALSINTTSTRFPQFANAFAPIVLMVPGIITLVISG